MERGPGLSLRYRWNSVWQTYTKCLTQRFPATGLRTTFRQADTVRYTRWFVTCGRCCRRWLPRCLWSKKLILIWVLFSVVLKIWGFLIVKDLLWTAHCNSHYVTLNQLEREQSIEAASPNSLCSQPSGNVRGGRRWHFRKPAKSTGQSTIKATAWNLNLYFIMYYVCLLFFLLFTIILSLCSKSQAALTPQLSKIGHMFIWTFLTTKI